MRSAGSCLAAALALSWALAPTAVAHSATLGGPGVRPFPSQSVDVSRRAVVTFTVPRKTPPAPPFPYLPKTAGGYFALYFPAIKQGWVNLRDPGSKFGWSVQFPLFGSARFPSLLPRHRYRMLVAVEHAGRVPLPFPMHVLGVRATSFRAVPLVHPIPMLTPTSPITAGAARDVLTDLPIESTGVVVDWAADQSLSETIQGDACPTTLPLTAVVCPPSRVGTFVVSQTGFGRGTPLQIVLGEGFNHAVNAPFVSTYVLNRPTPFEAATVVAFGLDPSIRPT